MVNGSFRSEQPLTLAQSEVEGRPGQKKKLNTHGDAVNEKKHKTKACLWQDKNTLT